MEAISLSLAVFAGALASPLFPVREQAARTLEDCPPPLLALLAKAPDLEVRQRVLIARERQLDLLIASIEPPNGQWPRLDILLYMDQPDGVCPHEWAYPFVPADSCCTLPTAYRQATRAYVGCLIRSGRTRQEIADLLNRMAEKEVEVGPLDEG